MLGERKMTKIENWVLKRIFGPKRVKFMGGWRTLLNEELCKFHSLSKISIESRRLRLAGHTALVWETGNANKILIGNPEGRKHLEDLSTDGRYEAVNWIPLAGCFEHGK
jgi:hypothetical protein